jgi:hypothetical protein
MNIKSNSWNSAIAVGVFIAGIIVGRITVLARPEKEPKREVIATTKAQPKSKRSRAATVTRPSSSASAVTIVPGESLFDGIAVRDFESIARAAAISPDDIENESLLRVLVSEWAKKDPLAAIQFAQELERNDLVYEGLLQMAQFNADYALNWIEQNEGTAGTQRYFTMAVYQGMAKMDPVGAVVRVEQMPAGAQRDELLSITVNQWAKQDIQAAFDWLDTVEPTPQFTYIYNQVMGNYIEQDPVQAAALITDMNSGDNKLSFASQVACELADQDVDYAVEWVQTLDGDEKKYALMGILYRWADGPVASGALNYILEHPEEPGYDNLFATVAVKMSHNQPDELEAVFESMTETDQISAAEQLASVYSVNDSDKCNEWLQSLEPGSVQDAALESALKTYKYSNVPQAFALSESISSDSLRKEQMLDVMTVWVPVDGQAAVQALDGSSALSAEEKEDILRQVFEKIKPDHYLLPAKP